MFSEGVIERTVGEYYAIQEQIEMGQMAALFYPKGKESFQTLPLILLNPLLLNSSLCFS